MVHAIDGGRRGDAYRHPSRLRGLSWVRADVVRWSQALLRPRQGRHSRRGGRLLRKRTFFGNRVSFPRGAEKRCHVAPVIIEPRKLPRGRDKNLADSGEREVSVSHLSPHL